MKPVIIGAGLAGLTVALSLAPRPVMVISAGKCGEECSSAWAQGGVASSVGEGDHSTLHAEDTLNAGAGLCDPAIVQQVTEDAADVIARFLARGVAFDRDDQGQLSMGLEGAHNRRRIVHVAGDGTGAAIMQATVEAARATPSIEIIENAVATEILTEDGICRGVVIEQNGARRIIESDHVVLATGGAGALWQYTTNPNGSWGCGLALAARAGAVLGDLEFMQFHPTAIDVGLYPMPLASEALRGEGSVLINETGDRFLAGADKAELTTRDVVSRAIWKQMGQGHRVYLDTRQAIGDRFAERFAVAYEACIAAGIDPVCTPIPVRPAAHYHMGGVVTDAQGRTSVKGLWACGEVACTGLHGANRLASNSLLEAASFGRRVAEDILKDNPSMKREPRGSLPLEGRVGEGGCKLGKQDAELGTAHPADRPPPCPSPQGGGNRNGNHGLQIKNVDSDNQIRSIVSTHLGGLRDKAGLEKAITELTPLAATSDKALVGLMIATAALRREESRGAHTRIDFPNLSPAWQRQQVITLADIFGA